MRNVVKWAVACLAVLCFALGPAQTPQPDPARTRAAFQEAWHVYLQSYSAATDSEEKALSRKALQLFKTLLPAIPKTAGIYDSILFRTQYTIGELEHYFKNLPGALQHYEAAVALRNRTNLPDSFFFKPLIFSGIIHYHQNQLDSAAKLFLQAEEIQNRYAVPLEESQRLYNTLGVINYETGNYRQAKHYFQKALDILSRANPSFTDLFVNYKINLAQIHFRLQEYKEATRIYKELLPFGRNRNEIYHNLGQISIHVGAARTALSYFKKVSFDDERKVRLYNSIGTAYMALRQLDSARLFFTKALSDRTAAADQTGVGMVFKNLGDLEVLTGRPEKALFHYTAAVHRFYPAYTDTDVKKNPTLFSGVFSYINLFETLVAKAKAAHQLYTNKKQVLWAKEELKAYQSAFQLIGYVERTYNSDEARLFLNRSKYAVHAQPIDIAYTLYSQTGDAGYLETLYELDQQNKASVLALNQFLSENQTERDTSTLQQEKTLRTAITRLSLQASQVKDSGQLAALQQRLRDLEIQLAALHNREETQKESSTRIPSVRFLQTGLLDASTALISYHLSAERLTTLIVTQDTVECSQQPLPPNFRTQVQTYIQAIREAEGNQQVPYSHALFKLLFATPLNKNITRLLIIPDDELLYLPFETLRNKQGDYLVQQYTVQYQYATSLLKKQTVKLSGEPTLAMAPFTQQEWHSKKDTFRVLPYSAKELEGSRGKKLLHSAATKKAFLENLTQYTVLHLATHARAGNAPGTSYIAFYPESDTALQALLFTEEIYHLPLGHTKLAILSACETGWGNLVKGEGVMSLSRAFRYAGCENIITSLWKADDFSTAWLMQKLTAYLEKGYAVDAAVQKAKVDYLRDATIHPRLKHPYYWAHLVFIGNFEPQSSSGVLYAVLAIAICFPLLLFFLWQKRKKNGPLLYKQ